ncbi:hydroxyacylglutathione hydrolase [Legionella beliardensis]|uniref:Hydroxyacylglutathione hydrolase n=1 Tax=Legionella beliardensis TaxID=91822 RepID=A0A378I9K7_9GAMM|nr:hydroxyacylglutathione hydrolase [Legionella beliardensis]STX29064.1 hydroxyacylglutathione hydrolase [Legionella beliardensis]
MTIVPLNAFQDNYIWLLIDTAGSVICVDPGDAQPVIDYLQKMQLTLKAILITHHHWDHSGGVVELYQHHPRAMVYAPADTRIPLITHTVHDNDLIDLSAWHFRVLSIPGHTSSHICYFETKQQLLFCGDTLFSAGCGRVFDGTYEQLLTSLNLLKNLPEDTKVYCGHEYTRQNLRFAATVEPNNLAIQKYQHVLNQEPNTCSLPSTIALEKQVNPFLRLHEPHVQNYAKMRGCEAKDELSIFKQIRTDKDNFT